MAVGTDARTSPTVRRRGVMTRRAVLGAALAGGAAVAASRLLGLNAATRPTAPGGATDWVSPLGRESAQVQQLLRRAAFGAGPAELERSVSAGFQKTLDRLLETPPAQPPPLPGGDSASRTSPLRLPVLQAWWLDHILTTPTPFAERMTLFWHGHFTSDYRKVGLQYPFLYWQNQTWRANALGNFKTFLYDVTVDPAMLRYLDLATSTGQAPNENYSRELMELFTMGAGTFTEDDVRAGARALAGWRLPTPTDTEKTGVLVPRRAYTGGPLTFLGKTANFDTKAVLAQILAQKATAPYVVRRLLIHFLMPNPPAATVNRLAAGFVKSGWNLKQLMSDVLSSDEFKSAAAYRSLVKQPVEFGVTALKALGVSSVSPQLLARAGGMGQVLFDPPDVGGWPTNEEWISSDMVLARVNFVTGLLGTQGAPPSAAHAHADQLDGVLSPATAALLNEAGNDLARWTIVLASPEFQLK